MNSFQNLLKNQKSDFHEWQTLDKYAVNSHPDYLLSIEQVMRQAVHNHSDSLMVRFDLHLPEWGQDDGRLLSRFFESLKARIKAREGRNQRNGIRVHKTKLASVWCREINMSDRHHYHVAIFVNQNAFYNVGDYRQVKDNLSGMIYKSWLSALGINDLSYFTLVQFPERCDYQLNVWAHDYTEQFNSAFQRLSYLAKSETKVYGDNRHNFGTSRISPCIKKQFIHYS